MPISVNFYTKIVEITSPTTEVTVQEIVNTVRDAEMSEEGMAFDIIIDAVGKADLGGGFQTGITMTLSPLWQIQFWNGVGFGIVSGGNIVGGVGNEPIKPTGGGDTVKLLQEVGGIIATTGGVLSPEDLADIADSVWDEPAGDHIVSESVGFKLEQARKYALWGLGG